MGTDDDDLRPIAGSVVIDAGNNALVPGDLAADADGQPRFTDDPATADSGLGSAPIVDLGGYELQL